MTAHRPTLPTGGGLTGRFRDVVNRGRATLRRARRRGPTPESAVTIEYSPRLDGDPDPGEIVWTWVPFEEDPTQGKDRPVVVIGRRGDKLVGVPLTTKRDDREPQVQVGVGDWDPQRRVSYARIWRMFDVDPSPDASGGSDRRTRPLRRRREGGRQVLRRQAAQVEGVTLPTPVNPYV